MSNFSKFDSLLSKIELKDKECYLRNEFKKYMGIISDIKNGDNVLLYFSAFMQKSEFDFYRIVTSQLLKRKVGSDG